MPLTKKRKWGALATPAPAVPTPGSSHGLSVAAGAHVAKKPRTDPASGRTITEGGGTTSGIHTLKDGLPSRGSVPSPAECTDVNKLNEAGAIHTDHSDGTVENDLSVGLGDYLHNNGLRIDEKWVKGHLQNDNLGGEGVSANLTPLTSTANKNMSGKFEGPLKRAVEAIPTLRKNLPPEDSLRNSGWTGEEINDIKDGLRELAVQYEVKVSANVKFPHSPNLFERSIRDHLVLNAEYLSLNSTLQEYLRINKKSLPDLPRKGAKIDTITGKIT
jgi:hypothetical protein